MLLLHGKQLVLLLQSHIPVDADRHQKKDCVEEKHQKQKCDADHKIPLQNTPGIERVRILGDHKQIQRNEHQRQHPEHIPGLRKIFVLDHPPHAVRRRIIGDGGKQPADRMIANHGPQTEPWRSLRLRQTGQHSGVDRPAKAVDTGKYRTDGQRNRSGFPKRDPERFYVDHGCEQGQPRKHRRSRHTARIAHHASGGTKQRKQRGKPQNKL